MYVLQTLGVDFLQNMLVITGICVHGIILIAAYLRSILKNALGLYFKTLNDYIRAITVLVVSEV